MLRYPERLGHYLVLLVTLGIPGLVACDDSQEDVMIIYAGMEMRAGEMTLGGPTVGGTMLGGVAGGTMAGGTMAGGTMAGGTMAGGTMVGGTMAGGTMAGGTMTGGTMVAGETGGMEEGDPCELAGIDPTSPCAVSIYEIKDPARVMLDRVVSVEGVISAIRSGDEGVSHLVLQVSSSHPDYRGAAYSAIWVYLNDSAVDLPEFSVGESLLVTAELKDFFGQRQLRAVSSLSELGNLYPNIVPTDVTAGDVATGGGLSEAYEGVLVRVSPVEVIITNPPAGPGDRDPTNEFVVAGGLRVNDFITSLQPLPEIGETWEQVQGVLRLGNGDVKLEPRSREDIGRVVPEGDPRGLRINEVDYSQPGADNLEFIEIINIGPDDAPLWGVTLELINGTNLSAYESYDLARSADVLASGEFLVVGSTEVLMSLPGAVSQLTLSEAVQNGPDGIRLVHDTIGILDSLGYGGLSLEEGSAQVEDEDVDGTRNSIGRCGPDLDQNEIDFVQQLSTPGEPNDCQ